ncbi:MAG: hypothetical protein HYX51_02935 [Chloroflexi bacterium]|nr:hypothetical protein [Chloroflexota bacterium]
MTPPVICLDADVLFAAAASAREYSASHVVLLLGACGLLTLVTPEQAIREVRKNLALKVPSKLPQLDFIIRQSVTVIPDPDEQEQALYTGQADPKDLPILVEAIVYGCARLITFNIRDFYPSSPGILIQRPKEFVDDLRSLMAPLGGPPRQSA